MFILKFEYRNEEEWNTISEWVHTLNEIHEAKIKGLKKYTDSVRNQQLREIKTVPNELEKSKLVKTTNGQDIHSEFNWDSLFDKLGTINLSKSCEKPERITKEIQSTFIDIEEWKMSYLLANTSKSNEEENYLDQESQENKDMRNLSMIKVETCKNKIQIKTEPDLK